MSNQEQLHDSIPALKDYPASVVYSLVAHANRTNEYEVKFLPSYGWRAELVNSYNSVAESDRFGGVLILKDSTEGDSRVTFNGSFTTDVQNGLGSSIKLPGYGYVHTHLDKEQINKSEIPPLAWKEKLAYLGASATAVAAPAYEVSYLAGPVIGTTSGMIGAGIFLGIGSVLSRRTEVREAINAWRELKPWFCDPRNGGISFAVDKNGKSALGNNYLAMDSAFKQEYQDVLKWLEDRPLDIKGVDRSPSVLSDDRTLIELDSPRYIKAILTTSHNPSELWQGGLGELVSQLADAEKEIIDIQSELETTKARQRVTHISNSDEITSIKKKLDEARQAQLPIVINLAKICKDSEAAWNDQYSFNSELSRQKEAVGLKFKILEGPKTDHQLYDILMGLHVAAYRAIDECLDLNEKASVETIGVIYRYLNGAAAVFSDPAQTKDIYDGLQKLLVEKLGYKFPGWGITEEAVLFAK